MTNGSVTAAFEVYEDFKCYKEGIYQSTSNKYSGDHAIKLIGWGVNKDGVKFWLAVNSWGIGFGEKGNS